MAKECMLQSVCRQYGWNITIIYEGHRSYSCWRGWVLVFTPSIPAKWITSALFSVCMNSLWRIWMVSLSFSEKQYNQAMTSHFKVTKWWYCGTKFYEIQRDPLESDMAMAWSFADFILFLECRLISVVIFDWQSCFVLSCVGQYPQLLLVIWHCSMTVDQPISETGETYKLFVHSV